MLVIGDSSALVALAVCGDLDILDKRFDTVRVPDAVFAECTVAGKTASDRLRVYLADKTVSVDLTATIITPSGMGRGELEAMSLYQNKQADFLLIDDRRARKVAIYNGLNTIGSIGILLWAKNAGYIPEIRSRIALIQDAGIFLSAKVRQEALTLASE